VLRRPRPARPDPLRIDRLRRRGQLRGDLDGVERLNEPRTLKETLIYSFIGLAVILVAAAAIIRIL
jgi:hypothetical protein